MPFRFAAAAMLAAALAATAAAPPAQADTTGASPAKPSMQLAQGGPVSPRALMRWCATVPDRYRSALFERRCQALRSASRDDLRDWCNRMPGRWQSERMRRRCSFMVGGGRRDGGPRGDDRRVSGPRTGDDDGSGMDEGGGRFGIGRCNVRNVTLVVRSRGCSGQTRRLNFRKPYLRPGESLIGSVDTGVIGKGYAPYGACNFKTRLRYRCIRGRVRIVQVFECRQAKTGPRGANCSLSYR